MDLPALSLTAVPGRRLATLELAREIERRGFAGMWVPSPFSGLGLCHALAHVTERAVFATSIAPIYFQQAEEFAQAAAFIHEVSGGRFRFGIGVSHQPTHERMGISPGRPLGDIRAFVEEIRNVPRTGGLPPVVLAAMRPRIIALAGEIAEGIVFANAARSHIVEAQHPVPNDLQPHTRKARRVRTTTAVIDHCQRQQTAVLCPIPAPLRKTTQSSRIEISPQGDRRSHAKPPIQGSELESETARSGNPPHESDTSAAGIMSAGTNPA